MERKKHVKSDKADIKNLVIGFLLGICLMLAIGAASSNYGDIGTYQCCAAGDNSPGVFVADTRTGQTRRLERTEAYDFAAPGSPKSLRHGITSYVD
jgi:hypothetical protein